jgi:hypothetical protein
VLQSAVVAEVVRDQDGSMREMSTRALGLIGWSMCAFSLALTALSLLLLTLNALEPGAHVFETRQNGGPRAPEK